MGGGRADGENAAELGRAEQEKEKRQKEAAAEGLDMLGDGRDRKDMLQKWGQRLRGKATAWQNVLIENGEAQPGLEERIKGYGGEEVRQAVSKARYHLKARAEAVEDKWRPECTLARCLCRLDGPQEPKGGYHGIRVRQPRRQVPMWLRMGEDDGAPLVYFHQVKHMWPKYAEGRRGAMGEDAEAGERQAKAQVLTTPRVEPKQAVLWMQVQQDAQVAACVDSTSRTVEVWGPTRQVLALALYLGETVRCSRGMVGEWDPETEMHRVQKVMAMVDYDGAAVGRAKGQTIQVVSTQASATGPADEGVTDVVQDGHTWWVVEPRGDRRQAVVYTAAALKRVEHPLMRWVGEVEEVRVERAEKIHERAVVGCWSRRWIGVRRQRKWRTSGNRSGWQWSGWPAAREGSSRGGYCHPAQRKSTERRHWREREGSWRGKGSSAWRWRKTRRGRGQVSRGDCGGEEGDK